MWILLSKFWNTPYFSFFYTHARYGKWHLAKILFHLKFFFFKLKCLFRYNQSTAIIFICLFCEYEISVSLLVTGQVILFTGEHCTFFWWGLYSRMYLRPPLVQWPGFSNDHHLVTSDLLAQNQALVTTPPVTSDLFPVAGLRGGGTKQVDFA
jgi:hypothetical protein